MGEILRPVKTGRRSILIGMAGLASAALVGCSAPGSGSAGFAAAGTQADAVSVHSPQSAAAAPTTEPTATPAATHAPVPSKEQVIAEFGGLRPKEWGLRVTGVVNGSASGHAALTFDACGGPGASGCDQQLLATLRTLKVPATLFVNQRWIHANPTLAAELAAEPLFELANHGFLHRPLSVTGQSAYGIPGTAGVGAVYDEIMGNQPVLQQITGKTPRFFRPGTAYYDEVAAAVTRRLGLLPVNFTINGDAGASYPAATVAAEVGRTGAGDIVISHFNQPGSGTAAGYARALPRLLDRGITFAQLGDVLPL